MSSDSEKLRILSLQAPSAARASAEALTVFSSEGGTSAVKVLLLLLLLIKLLLLIELLLVKLHTMLLSNH